MVRSVNQAQWFCYCLCGVEDLEEEGVPTPRVRGQLSKPMLVKLLSGEDDASPSDLVPARPVHRVSSPPASLAMLRFVREAGGRRRLPVVPVVLLWMALHEHGRNRDSDSPVPVRAALTPSGSGSDPATQQLGHGQ